MKAFMQSALGAVSLQAANNTYALFYMSGSVPQTPAQVKAAVDLSDVSDLLSKCVGVGLASDTIALDTTGVGRYNVTYTLLEANLAYLKGGSLPAVGGYYIPMPSRAYYSNGRKSDLWSMPPNLWALSYACVKNSYQKQARFKFRDTAPAYASPKAAGSEIVFNVEYDKDTTISALRVASGVYTVNNNYMYNAKVEYWNGSAWASAYSGSDVISYSTMKDLTFAAVTAQKYRVTLYPYSETAGYYSMPSAGFALMHTSAPSTTPVPDITWGVLVPYPDADTISSSVYDNTSIVYNSTFPVDTSANPLIVRNAPMYGKVTNNFPAIIDSCSQDSTASKMVISKSIGLTSDDHPTLAAYKYYPGDLS